MCRSDCTEPDTVLNGGFQLTGLATNNTLTYWCDVGYQMKGPSTAVCHFTNYWKYIVDDEDDDDFEDVDTTPPQCVGQSRKVFVFLLANVTLE